uniref:Uncharacterized protein n=1 Tax=Timema bartmani TaxID=61472 RepID=A0A7R9ENZ8_9NEOP|nr:unnamed protein product [Timema bartmani]
MEGHLNLFDTSPKSSDWMLQDEKAQMEPQTTRMISANRRLQDQPFLTVVRQPFLQECEILTLPGKPIYIYCNKNLCTKGMGMLGSGAHKQLRVVHVSGVGACESCWCSGSVQERIFKFLTYEEISLMRLVCQELAVLANYMLHTAFQRVGNTIEGRLHHIKTKRVENTSFTSIPRLVLATRPSRGWGTPGSHQDQGESLLHDLLEGGEHQVHIKTKRVGNTRFTSRPRLVLATRPSRGWGTPGSHQDQGESLLHDLLEGEEHQVHIETKGSPCYTIF